MLKTTESSKVLVRKAFKADSNKVIGSDSNANKIIIDLSKSKKLKNIKFKIQVHIKAIKEAISQILSTNEVFNLLKQVFIKALIVQYFDLESYIQIETDV